MPAVAQDHDERSGGGVLLGAPFDPREDGEPPVRKSLREGLPQPRQPVHRDHSGQERHPSRPQR